MRVWTRNSAVLGRWRATETLYACVDRKKMAVIAEEQTPPSSTQISHNNVIMHEAATTFTNVGTCMSTVFRNFWNQSVPLSKVNVSRVALDANSGLLHLITISLFRPRWLTIENIAKTKSRKFCHIEVFTEFKCSCKLGQLYPIVISRSCRCDLNKICLLTGTR